MQQTSHAIRPFHVQIPDEALADLRRLAAARWHSRELASDRSQGVQLAPVRGAAQRAAAVHHRDRPGRRPLPHVPSPHPDALPVIMTHGWPGSVIDLLETVGPLTDTPSSGGRADDSFDLVLPSVPGYGFSAEPAELGWDLTARAWAEPMRRLGYDHYVAQGGGLAPVVSDAMGRLAPEGPAGIHTNLLVPALNDPAALPSAGEQEQAALGAIQTFGTTGNGYFVERSTRPQTHRIHAARLPGRPGRLAARGTRGRRRRRGQRRAHRQRRYQLIRKPRPSADRRFEIEFGDPGVLATVFTFGLSVLVYGSADGSSPALLRGRRCG